MTRNYLQRAWLVAALSVAGCQGTDGEATDRTAAAGTQTTESPVPAETAESHAPAGKPSAPISIDYHVVGTPIVGHPVNIDLDVSSTRGDTPVKLSYRVLDQGSLSFPKSQTRELSLSRVPTDRPATRQVTVVPQREGRLYLNVTAEIETEDGALIKTMAIPIQVGGAPAAPETNGEIMEDAAGETVISLPADEN